MHKVPQPSGGHSCYPAPGTCYANGPPASCCWRKGPPPRAPDWLRSGVSTQAQGVELDPSWLAVLCALQALAGSREAPEKVLEEKGPAGRLSLGLVFRLVTGCAAQDRRRGCILFKFISLFVDGKIV
jgi:hypothetical protein